MWHSRAPYQDHGQVDQWCISTLRWNPGRINFGSFWEVASVTGTLSRVVAYTCVQVPSGLTVRVSGVSQPASPSISAMAQRSLRLGVGAHGWVVLLCQSREHYFNLRLGPWTLQAPNLHFSEAGLNVFKCILKGHSQLWGRAELDTTFVSLKRVYLNPKSNERVGYI